LSSSMTVFITTQLDALVAEYEILDNVVGLIKFGLRAVPLILITFMFSLLFAVMPNTKVKFSSAFFAGLFTALAYQSLQYFYIEFQVGVSKYNAIYGSLAALPLFFIWLQLSWTVVLFGAEFAFAHQNANRHYFDTSKTKPSLASKKKLALLIMTAISKNFERGEEGLTDEVIGERIGVPVRFVVLMLEELTEAKLIHEALNDHDEVIYLPSIDVHKLTIEYVIERIEQQGLDQVSMGKLSEVDALVTALDDLQDNARKSPSNRLLIEL
ncbi:MAG: YihY/virulence factor BrkB family protein, partial [Bacteroidota bacterium]